jgi:hypothetical protein
MKAAAKTRPGHVAYLTRNMPTHLRDRLHLLVRAKRRQGFVYTMEEVVNCALEIGVAMMEEGLK